MTPGELHLSLLTERLVNLLGLPPQSDVPKSLTHTIPVQRSFTGKAVRLIDNRGCAATTDSDESLTNLIIRARQWWARLAKGDISIKQLAPLEGVSESYITRVVRLAFLSPRVVEAILDGRQKSRGRCQDAHQHRRHQPLMGRAGSSLFGSFG